MRKLKEFKKAEMQFGLFLTQEKLDAVHDVLKFVEMDCDIVTQHIPGMTMKKAIGDRGAWMVLTNLLLKTNIKLGGVNHTLAISRICLENNRRFNQSIL